MTRAGFVWGAGLVALLVALPAAAESAAQTFNTALPVATGDFVLRQQLFIRSAGGDSRSADREAHAWGSTSVLGYGVREDVTVFGAVPVAAKSLEATAAGGARVERDTAGLGDVRVLARWTAHQADAPGRTFRIAPFAGVEAPTGEDDARDARGRLPRPLQPGSGSWDPFAGVVATWQTLDYQLDGQISHKVNTRDEGFAFGDVTRLDVSGQYRVWPGELGTGVPGFLYASLDANLVHRSENTVAGRHDPASGGVQVFLSPGLQYVTKRWVLEGVVQLPVAQARNELGLEDDFVARLGFRVNF